MITTAKGNRCFWHFNGFFFVCFVRLNDDLSKGIINDWLQFVQDENGDLCWRDRKSGADSVLKKLGNGEVDNFQIVLRVNWSIGWSGNRDSDSKSGSGTITFKRQNGVNSVYASGVSGSIHANQTATSSFSISVSVISVTLLE